MCCPAMVAQNTRLKVLDGQTIDLNLISFNLYHEVHWRFEVIYNRAQRTGLLV